MPDTLTLPVPPVDTRELWTMGMNLAARVHETQRAIDDASALGLPLARLCAEISRLQLDLDIVTRECDRRMAR